MRSAFSSLRLGAFFECGHVVYQFSIKHVAALKCPLHTVSPFAFTSFHTSIFNDFVFFYFIFIFIFIL